MLKDGRAIACEMLVQGNTVAGVAEEISENEPTGVVCLPSRWLSQSMQVGHRFAVQCDVVAPRMLRCGNRAA
jgi:hypothetical protein